jgi:hypothetical protein
VIPTDDRPPLIWDMPVGDDHGRTGTYMATAERLTTAPNRWVRIMGPAQASFNSGRLGKMKQTLRRHEVIADYEFRSRSTGKQSCVFARYIGEQS